MLFYIPKSDLFVHRYHMIMLDIIKPMILIDIIPTTKPIPLMIKVAVQPHLVIFHIPYANAKPRIPRNTRNPNIAPSTPANLRKSEYTAGYMLETFIALMMKLKPPIAYNVRLKQCRV